MESSSSSGSKRRRLILVSSNVSSRRSDLPAIFESLNDDTLTTVLEFVGGKSYRSFGGVNKRCREVYLNTPGMTKETYLFGYGPLSRVTDRYDSNPSLKARRALSKGVVLYNRLDVLHWALHERNDELLERICVLAAEEGRTDILNEVWNNVSDEDVKENIFESVDCCAAIYGKLNVLKWYETKGVYIWKEGCAERAAEKGHFPILQWLREEQGLRIKRELYVYAVDGGQLRVIKWLRQLKVPWDGSTFRRAAWKGNLNMLQWLHNEGCPWPENDRVSEGRLKAEVIDWLRSHGYGDRIVSFF